MSPYYPSIHEQALLSMLSPTIVYFNNEKTRITV